MTKNMKGLAGVFFAVCFVSCSRTHTSKARVERSVVLTQSVHRALEHGLFTPGNWPEAQWWQAFGDSQLNRCIAEAVTNSPSFLSAKEKITSAQAQALGARAPLFPHLSGVYRQRYQHLSANDIFRIPPSPVPPVINETDVGLKLTYDVDLWGKNRSKYRAALGMQYMQEAETAHTKVLLATSVAHTYIRLQLLHKRLRAVEALYQSASELYELHLLRQAYALDSTLDVHAASDSLLQMREMRTAIENKAALTQMQLKVLMGRSPDDRHGIEPRDVSYTSAIPLPNRLSIDLLSRRADVMAALWHVESHAHRVGAAKAAFFPNIDLTAFGGVSSLSFGDLFTPQSLTGMLMPAIHLPLFKGGRLKAGLQQASSDFSAAVYEYNARVLHAAEEVATTMRTLRALHDIKRIRLERSATRESSYQLERLRCERGIANRMELLENKKAWLQEQLEAIESEESYLLKVVELMKALGGGYAGKE